MAKYFITHCDISFLNYAERLFETLSIFSQNKIIFYTIDFDYDSKFANVIPIRFNSQVNNKSINNYSLKTSRQDSHKAFNVFLKAFVVKDVLKNDFYKDDDFCYLDADCLGILNCDNVFENIKKITNYPLFNRCCWDYLIMDGAGDPFSNGGFDLNLTLESKLVKFLNYDLNSRKQYVQTGVFVFNKKCLEFIDEWCRICSMPDLIKDWKELTPFHEETVANVILWNKDYFIDLSQSLINLPYDKNNDEISFNKIKEMLNSLENTKNERFFIGAWCSIPAKKDLKDLFFYHGKVSDFEYNYLKEYMTNIYLLKVNSQSLGDTIASTPTLRKLYNSYNKKIDVVTHHPDIFINNKYVNRVFSFNEFINEKLYKEVFNTFLGLGGEKNKFGVEKKHNTIDIRQFHALDLGFMLNENEMEYDYIANEYIEIENLPQNYVCLHVANTWPSRTYSDENWQNLINLINEENIPVVLIGKNGHESGFYNIDKPTKKLNFKIGLDLTNKLDISQCWHVINKSKCFITMDSGLLHLAGTTDAEIIQLGSSINNKLRAPFRKNSQAYKYKYISGPCSLFCASDIKYGVKEWSTIQGVPPLIKCLENKSTYECHPNVDQVIDIILYEIFITNYDSLIEITNFDSEELLLQYVLKRDFKNKIKLTVIDDTSGFILYQESLKLCSGMLFWTTFKFCKNYITDSVSIIFESNGKIFLNKKFTIHKPKNINLFSDFSFEKDIEISSYVEVLHSKNYSRYDIDVNENDVVVDIGSNQGAFIKYALDKKSSMIYSCDPNPKCTFLLKKYYGNYNNLFLNEFAISDKCGESLLCLADYGEATGCAKIPEAKANIKFNYESGKKIKINSVTFKDFIKLNKINYINFLKIDCEGSEVFIFVDENKNFFKNNVDKIVLEFHNEQYIDIMNYLDALNFETYIEHHPENLGMIYAKNKNMKKIGLLLTAYNSEDYIDSCLDPWIKLKEDYNIKIAANSGMFSDYKALGFKNRNAGTLNKLNQYKFDFFIKTDDENLLDEDSSRNKCLDYLINEQKCDLVWILDADEIYTQDQIRNIIDYVNKNDALYYKINFKNYVFTKEHIINYIPPRIFWVNKNSGIKQFHFDNDITYNNGSFSEEFEGREIPKNIALVDHYSWLAQDPRTQEKIIYQNTRFIGEDGARCTYSWDNDYNCLIYNENFYQKRDLKKPFEYEPPKYLFITGHLSTGGSPKYLEWLINKIKIEKNTRIKVIEWNLYSTQYNIQRNSIINLVGEKNFISLGSYEDSVSHFLNKEKEVISLINEFEPNCIHLNEMSENFAIRGMSEYFLSYLYDDDRKYKIYETSHAKNTNFKSKRFMPDEFWPVTQYHYNIIKSFTDNVKLVEYDIAKKNRPDRNAVLLSLGLDPDYFHVLQVGLLNHNKNQKYTFDLAKNLIDRKVQFHFIGNLCFIDECNIDKQQVNCKIWGERSDVDAFMSCMDLFIMPSFEELNPIALKEAVSWGMKCFINNWSTIENKYLTENNIDYISSDNVKNYINSKSESLLNDFKLNTIENNDIICTFFPTPKIEIIGNDQCSYNIVFLDKDTNTVHYETNLNVNMWTCCSIEYYCNWKVIVKNLKSNVISQFDFNLNNKTIKIINESPSLGDSISWMPAIDEFQKKHHCKVDYFTAKKFLFESEYPNINFYNYSDTINKHYYSQYKIGCFSANNKNMCKSDWRDLSLQQIAFNILGLEWKETKTKIKKSNNFKLNLDKYVCIAIQSTSQSRYWNNDLWQLTVIYLKSLGYKVVCVDKNYSFGIEKYFNICPSNIDYFAGEHSFEEIIDIINNCEFFIGLSSGLSWVTWALNKKIIKINNSVDPAFEFSNDYIVQNKSVCTNCFTNKKHVFNSSDWAWCPENKNFECSKHITFEMVKDKIDLLIQKNKYLIIYNTDIYKN